MEQLGKELIDLGLNVLWIFVSSNNILNKKSFQSSRPTNLMSRKDLYIITKDGAALFDYTIGEFKQVDAVLVSGFLSAVNSFATKMGWPEGVSYIRSGALECRIWPGKDVYVAFIIETTLNATHYTEHLVEDLARTISERFEAKFPLEIAKAVDGKFCKGGVFSNFREDVNEILADFKNETYQLYQKVVLIESMYAHVPQKWCVPLIERLGSGELDVTGEFHDIRKRYPQMKKAIAKVNRDQAPVWELFGIPLYSPE
ncbi:MAG: hypothetical protein RBG13Loki_4185 [Promethearchaeota archaeon CR_4]|nr:MAG: hypothetical protein RBG13Loki_4185 [Candidatus Lokiarchaeota archaeon CR_4]